MLNLESGAILSSFYIADSYESVIRNLISPSFVSMPRPDANYIMSITVY